jgi:carboxyl-terminal processing protease
MRRLPMPGLACRLVAALGACLCIALPGTLAPTRAAFEDAAPGLRTIHTAYADLLGLSYKHPSPAALLQAGWAEIGAVLPAGQTLPSLPQLPDDPDAAFTAFSGTYAAFVARYFKTTVNAQPELLALACADGMARAVGERHTGVALVGATGLGSGGGFGLGIATTGTPPVVTVVAPDSPAQLAGIKPGDVIVAIDGKPPGDASGNDVRTLAGAGTGRIPALTLTLQRDGKTFDVRVTPGTFPIPTATSRLLAGSVGYLKLDAFTFKTAHQDNGLTILADIDRRLDALDQQGARALVLDLRDNGGGDLDTAAALLGRFLPEGTLTMRESDGAGHQIADMVNGGMRSRQLPMVVLVNGRSASASELVAAVLKEQHRALLVGTRTAGALAAARLLPLDQFAALEVGMAAITTAGGTVIDGAGVPVDIAVPDTRTPDDYRNGRDPQLDAALAAVPRAPAPPAPETQPATAPPQAIHRLLTGYAPPIVSLTEADGLPLQVTNPTGDDTTDPTDIAYTGTPDPRALLQSVRARGWLGRHEQRYGLSGKNLTAALRLDIDLYATSDGAAAALRANDTPDLEQPIAPPAQLGEETRAFNGLWEQLGLQGLVWRYANVIVALTYIGAPASAPRTDLLLAAARQIDALFQRYPVTNTAFQQGVQTAQSTPAATATATSAAPAPTPAAATDSGATSVPHPVTTAGGGSNGIATLLLQPLTLILAAFAVALAVTGRYAVKHR